MMRTFRIPTLSLILLVMVTACGGERKPPAEEQAPERLSAEDRLIISDMSQAISDMPPPTLLPHTLEGIGSTYDPTLVNGFDKASAYEKDEDKAAMNLGVYATDLGYQVAFGQIDEALSHMRAVQHLASTVGVATAFNVELLQIWENEPDSHDSISAVLNATALLEEKTLESSERLPMAALALTGSFIEGLYLAAKKIDDHDVPGMTDRDKDERLQPIMRILLEQEKPLKDIIQLMRDIPDDETILQMINELEILVLLYDSDLQDIEEAMKEEDFLLTPALLQDVTIAVENIRAKIVS